VQAWNLALTKGSEHASQPHVSGVFQRDLTNDLETIDVGSQFC